MSERNHIIYQYTSPSGKKYIGQTSDEKKRKQKHKSNANKCTVFASAIKKYGYENMKYEVLVRDLNQNEANFLEEIMIFEKNTLSPNGYNLRSGGMCQLHTDISKIKNKQSKLKYYQDNPDAKEKCRQTTIKYYQDNPDAKEKLSQTHLERYKNNPDAIEKNRQSLLKYYQDNPDAIEKNRQSLLKYYQDNPDAKNRLAKKYKITYPNEKTEVILGLTSFCRDHNLTQSAMGLVAQGKRKHHKGYKCEYFPD